MEFAVELSHTSKAQGVPSSGRQPPPCWTKPPMKNASHCSAPHSSAASRSSPAPPCPPPPMAGGAAVARSAQPRLCLQRPHHLQRDHAVLLSVLRSHYSYVRPDPAAADLPR